MLSNDGRYYMQTAEPGTFVSLEGHVVLVLAWLIDLEHITEPPQAYTVHGAFRVADTCGVGIVEEDSVRGLRGVSDPGRVKVPPEKALAYAPPEEEELVAKSEGEGPIDDQRPYESGQEGKAGCKEGFCRYHPGGADGSYQIPANCAMFLKHGELEDLEVLSHALNHELEARSENTREARHSHRPDR